MKTKISTLINDVKRTSTLVKWIDEIKHEAKTDAYEHRVMVYKRELEDELKKLDYILPLWNMFKKLRKKSNDYDVLIEVDRKGYITMQVIFPITQEELDKSRELKHNWDINNKGYSMCCRLTEQVYKVCNERVNKVLKGLELCDYQRYEQYGSNPLIRWCDITSVKF